MAIKVLHVTFDMTIGGTQQVIRQLVENLDENVIQSEIVCIDGRLGELGEILQEQGVSLHILKRQLGFDASLIKSLFQLIRANQYDVIHCHQYTPFVYGVLASLFTKAKVIFTEHGRFYPDYGTWKRKLINPLFSVFTAKITAISQATKQALVKFEGFNADKIEVIYNGIADKSDIEVDEIALKAEFGIPQSAFIFGTISRLQPIKNQSMMIKAFKQAHDQHNDTHLLIVGDGEIRAELEALARTLGLKDNVTFTGFQRDPYRFHKIIDVFLLTSFSEGASMTLLEAMSFSTPCIVTDVGGNPELISHGITGCLVSLGDENEFVDYCLTLVENIEERKETGMNARKIYLQRFNLMTMTLSYQEKYAAVSNQSD
jgi:glycosyltransferase involved in cell wall biosynthesis